MRYEISLFWYFINISIDSIFGNVRLKQNISKDVVSNFVNSSCDMSRLSYQTPPAKFDSRDDDT